MSEFLHHKLHEFYGWLGFIIRLPFHYIFHNQEYGHNLRFILCDCNYCYDGGYYCMNCKRCYDFVTQRTKGGKGNLMDKLPKWIKWSKSKKCYAITTLNN